MHLNNAYRIYCTLLQPVPYNGRLMSDCIADLAIDLLQQGEPMRSRGSGVPPVGTGEGRKIRADAKSHFDNNNSTPRGRNHARTPLSPELWNRSTAYRQRVAFSNSLKNNQWRSHQSVASICKNDGGNCQYDCCPGLLRTNKRKRSYPTRYRCIECSIAKGTPVYLCNTTKKRADGTYFAVLCHMKYHEQQFGAVNAGDSSSDRED